jgi:hypothetical protein
MYIWVYFHEYHLKYKTSCSILDLKKKLSARTICIECLGIWSAVLGPQ